MNVADAVQSYHEAEDAYACAARLRNRALDDLCSALGVSPRHRTIGHKAEKVYFSKNDVDVHRALTPSQRKRLRSLKVATK